MNIKSIYFCPACGTNLRLETNNNFLFCAHGPCKVSEMNEGAQGQTENEAHGKLVATLENLTEQGKYKEPLDGWFYRRRDRLPYLRPTGIALLPSSPNWENTDIAKLAEPTINELTGSD